MYQGLRGILLKVQQEIRCNRKETYMSEKIDYKSFETLPDLLKAIREAERYQVERKDGTSRQPNLNECRKIVGELVPKEKYFQTKILNYLKTLPNAMFWKEQSGFGYQGSGLPDICGIINGRFYGFEVKRPFIGKVSPIQRERIEEIRKAGGVAEVVSYVEEVEKIIKGASA